jgi:hypothetical protein
VVVHDLAHHDHLDLIHRDPSVIATGHWLVANFEDQPARVNEVDGELLISIRAQLMEPQLRKLEAGGEIRQGLEF